MTDEPTGTKVKDESQDQKYFTITPRLVWALARNPYDYTLWATIKGIAGESGECFLSTDELAILSMMSVGQAHDSRKYWMEMKMLFGDLRKDPGYPQSVWHLSIPNIWALNIEWATKFVSLKDRVQFKREQTASIRETRQKAREEAKKDEKTDPESLHTVKASPSEGIHSPHEPEPSPSELKNIHKNNHKEEIGGEETPPTPSPDWGISWQLSANVKEVVLPSEEQLAEARLKDAVNMFSPDYHELVRAFILATGIFPIKGDVSGWTKAFRDQSARTGLSPEAITATVAKMSKDKLTITDPFSVVGIAGSATANKTAKPATQTIAPLNTPFAQSVENYVPKPRQARQGTR